MHRSAFLTFLSCAVLWLSTTVSATTSHLTTAASHRSTTTTIHHTTTTFNSTPISTGTSGGYFYSFWTSASPHVTYTNLAHGSFSVLWSGNKGNFVGGKGWRTGSATRSINFSGSFGTTGNSYLSVYGWSVDQLVEYYIVENYGFFNPKYVGKVLGTVKSDGGTYDVVLTERKGAPSVEGVRDFRQYWSVRRERRSEGKVTVGNHFRAWKKLGLELGRLEYQIVAVEGWESSGEAKILVS